MLPELLLAGEPRLLLHAAIGITIVLLFHQLVLTDSREHRQFWKTQPWVGVRVEWFSRFRASLRTIRGIRQMLEEGYEKGRAFVLPTIAEAPWVVLPPSSMRELLAKSDRELDHEIIHADQLQHYYTQGPLGWHAVQVPLQFDLVRRQLTRQLPLVLPIMADEVDRSFRQYWGTRHTASTEVKVKVFETCTQIVTRVANRVFAGPDICRNEDFLHHSRQYSESVDGLQWLLEECVKRDDPREIDPRLITQRLLMLNFVAIETMAMSITHTVIDLYSAPDCATFVAQLREECERVWREENQSSQPPPQPHPDQWTKAGLDRLVRVDSTIRESMRVSDLSYIAVPRMVAPAAGLDFDQGLLHLPRGVRVCVPAHAIHRDPLNYADPLTFHPFRFSDLEENRKKALSIATTTDAFLVFGHGRHACPGRFFAAQTMKLMLAYLVRHYEVEPIDQGPEKEVQVGTARPSAQLCLRVRRRD
ncbi:cytochrome P450 [Aspergillus aculeatinus CBS 121060]|uniref:Ent-kaurene oxidase n=1 Tax=Aspergillus aculeatinus CBS 121060 TaxID=1448322 RepID=A0ACD1HA90_9EURO|nr:putative Ent-kaurene oxidase [Aspergillus aculeatinus CBS 121060]RAH70348.1 putative Ent-kaurene oxidase [Aspergillus aculeatinus CBS 121060]